jgi:hypothetical protein
VRGTKFQANPLSFPLPSPDLIPARYQQYIRFIPPHYLTDTIGRRMVEGEFDGGGGGRCGGHGGGVREDGSAMEAGGVCAGVERAQAVRRCL